MRNEIKGVKLEACLNDLELVIRIGLVLRFCSIETPKARGPLHEILGCETAVGFKLRKHILLAGNPTGSSAFTAIVHRKGDLAGVRRPDV